MCLERTVNNLRRRQTCRKDLARRRAQRKRRAVAEPLPLLGPVMTTTLPVISCVIGGRLYFAGALAAFHLIPQPMLGI
jgi:hypothetical protein